VQLLLSSDPRHLRNGEDRYDYVLLIGVIEHLLADERRTLLPDLWSHLNPGGLLFVIETPHRYSPIDAHTTLLPLINYLPDRLALEYARRVSKRVPRNATWAGLLRDGVRGSTESEVLSLLNSAGAGRAELLKPTKMGLRDRFDVWYALTKDRPPREIRKYAPRALRSFERLTSIGFVPDLDFAVKKIA
jgi:hypothetical protein